MREAVGVQHKVNHVLGIICVEMNQGFVLITNVTAMSAMSVTAMRSRRKGHWPYVKDVLGM